MKITRQMMGLARAATAISLGVALISLGATVSHAQQLTGTLVPQQSGVDLTALGTTDWAVWGYSSSGTSTSLVRDVGKVGGSSISSLSDISNGNPLRGLGQFGLYGESIFNWSNGTPTGSATNAFAGIQHNGTNTMISTIGEGFSFTVPASVSVSTMYLYFTVNQGAALVTANLSDNSAPGFSSSFATGTNSNQGGILTIRYAAASAGQSLTVKGILNVDNSGGHTGNFAVTGVALASGATAPEPGAGALTLIAVPLAGFAICRQRRESATS